MTDVSTTCAVVIFRVKVSCITSVDGTNLWLLTSVSVRHVLGRLSVKLWCYWLWRFVMPLVRFDRSIVTVKQSFKFSAVQSFCRCSVCLSPSILWSRLYGAGNCWLRLRAVSYFSLQSYCTKKPKHAGSGEAASRDKEGVSPRRKNKRLLTLLFCLGTTKLSR